MPSAGLPERELERQRDLLSYQLLDTPPEEDFDNLTKLASLIAATPIALLSLADRSRQWFKSRVGLNVSEIDRDLAICSYTILQSGPLEITDTRRDSRFANNPYVVNEPHIISYFGVPLRSPRGFPLGTLCVMDRRPRMFDAEVKAALELLAAQAIHLITSRHRIIQSARLSALGEMSAGIAHEINNSLLLMRASCQNLQAIADTATANRARTVDQAVDRVAKIVRHLLQFARHEDNDPFTACELDRLIQETLTFCLVRFYQRQISIKTNLESGCFCECRPGEISQIILNLLNNAFDAIDNQTERWVQIDLHKKSEDLELSVTDSGPGIPPDLREKVMTPFFTTKEFGKGTGLGLSITKGIVEAHGGHFKLDTESKQTRFVVTLPQKRKNPRDLTPEGGPKT